METGHVLVIAEKPDAAKKIAAALGNATAHSTGTIDIPVAFDGKHYVVCSASGHLYGLADPELNRSIFPVFDVDWFPKEVEPSRQRYGRRSKFAGFVQKKIESISSASRGARLIVNACDFDTEGETIGFNLIEFACAGSANTTPLRAKFSTLTQEEIRRAFTSLEATNGSLARAGRMRHMVDFLWGVNLSRALTESANRESQLSFANITIGRVQGPTIAFVVDREVEIMTHVPVPCWDVTCTLNKDGETFDARYKKSPIKKEAESRAVFNAVSTASVATAVQVNEYSTRLPPRYPFDLGELQREAFYNYGLTPSNTLAVAERLYLRALISYPRTESQKLPPSIKPQRILGSLRENQSYSALVDSLLAEKNRRMTPWQGPLDDPAHPAIYPTGELPRQPLSTEERKVYDLIVRRFCNAFAPDAIVEKVGATLDISSYEFLAEGSRVVEEGWMKYYPSKFNLARPLVKLTEGERVGVENASFGENYGARPSRYTEGSLLSKMESENIGTKATRADTISTLISRGYLAKTKQLVPSENALNLTHRVRKFCPQIFSSEMTRALERKLESLRQSTEREELVVEEALASLRMALRELSKMDSIAWRAPNPAAEQPKKWSPAREIVLGTCPNCKTGNLRVIRSPKSRKRFIGCTSYKKGCKSSSPLPPRGSIKARGDRCTTCNWPVISISYFHRSRAPPACSNFACPSRKTKTGAV